LTRLRLTSLLAALLAALAVTAAPAQAAKPPFYGVVTQLPLSSHDDDLMQQAGVGTLRVQLGWPIVQQQAGRCQAGAQVGVCDWRAYDQLVGGLASRGIETFPYLLNSPPFIAKNPNTPPVRSKAARRGWSDFTAAAAKRYGPGGTYWTSLYPLEYPLADPVPIRHWQIWNEPSAQPFWNPKPKTREYAKLVKLTSKSITSVDEDAYMVLAGLFGTPTVGIDQPDFIRGLYKVPKIERYFDAVAIHPYGPDLDRVEFQVDWALDEMRRAGDRRADLWISEIGWASDRVHNQLGVGKKGQAKMLAKSFRLFEKKRKKWNLVAVNWYAWQDVDGEGFCDFCRRSGLITLNQQPKPSYEAFRDAAK
jgi:phage terminase large subunit-like protein